MTLLNEFANLVSGRGRQTKSILSIVAKSTARKINIFQDEINSIFFEVTYANGGVEFFVGLHCDRGQ
jgi:hypothetical protein